MNENKFCHDEKHGQPCPLPCDGCVADDCDLEAEHEGVTCEVKGCNFEEARLLIEG